MAGLVRFPSSLRTSASAGRLRFALAVSALAHWALLAAPVVETRWPGAASSAIDAPMTVRIAPPPVAVPDAPAVTEAEESRMPGPAAGNSGRARDGLPATVVAPPGADAPVVLRVPDLTYYPARELDDYPHPARPLELDRPPGAGSIRVLLLIDEHGMVNDVSLVEAAGGGLEDALRTALGAARFIPARKDGRAVRSRIVLSVSFAGERE
jgi:protein TonB